MTDPRYSVLLVNGDARVRANLSDQLSPLGCTVLEAEDGDSAFRVLRENDVRVVLSELYLKTGDEKCLIRAVRRAKALRNTRTLAHTSHGTSPDRDWAMKAGADAFLIQPTRAERLRYVVARLATEKRGGFPKMSGPSTRSTVARRDSLDDALLDLERGSLKGTSSIVFSKEWWTRLTPPQQTTFRSRAKRAGVRLRSDSLLSNHFVEVRGPSRAASPYRRA
jgi:CheY-like chemotaxis protein